MHLLFRFVEAVTVAVKLAVNYTGGDPSSNMNPENADTFDDIAGRFIDTIQSSLSLDTNDRLQYLSVQPSGCIPPQSAAFVNITIQPADVEVQNSQRSPSFIATQLIGIIGTNGSVWYNTAPNEWPVAGFVCFDWWYSPVGKSSSIRIFSLLIFCFVASEQLSSHTP